jgi:hypothetical protein
VCEQRGDEAPPLTLHVPASRSDLGDVELAVGVIDEVVYRGVGLELADVEAGVGDASVLLTDQLQHASDRHTDASFGEIDTSNFKTRPFTIRRQLIVGRADGDIEPPGLLAEDELQQGVAVGASRDLAAKRVVETQLRHRQNVSITAYYG